MPEIGLDEADRCPYCDAFVTIPPRCCAKLNEEWRMNEEPYPDLSEIQDLEKDFPQEYPHKYGSPELVQAMLEKLHPGEPFFLIRGQDVNAIGALMGYQESLIEGEDHENLSQIQAITQTFLDWQSQNTDKMKDPD